MAGILEALGISPHDIDLLRDRSIPLDRPMPFDPSNQVPGSKPAVRVGDIAGMAMQSAPGVGDAYSALQAIKDLEEERYASSILNGIGALPMVAGTFAGIGAKTADVLKLERANKMAVDGVDPVKIWQETGWTNQFPDGKWRFEVDDSATEYRPGRVRGERLPKIIEDDQETLRDLSDALDLKSIMEEDPELTLGEAKKAFAEFAGRPVSKGAGLWTRNYTIDDIGVFRQEILDRVENPKINAPLSSYVENSGILEAYPQLRDTNTVLTPQRDMPGYTGSYSPGFGIRLAYPEAYNLRSGKSVLSHEIQHAVDDLEGFARGANVQFEPKSYWNNSAEALARLTQHRLNYTPEQRQQIPPWTEFDVPIEEQIVRSGGGPAMAAGLGSTKFLYRGLAPDTPENRAIGAMFNKGQAPGEEIWSHDRLVAKGYTQGSGNMKIAAASPEAKVLTLINPDGSINQQGKAFYSKHTGLNPTDEWFHARVMESGFSDIAEAVRKNNYDIVQSMDLDGPETIVLNKGVLQELPRNRKKVTR